MSKVAEFVKANQFNEKVQINDNGIFETPVDLFKESVLDPLEISVEKYGELVDTTNQFHAGLVSVAGTKAQEHFKANAEASELALQYQMGEQFTHNTIFTRGGGEVTPNVVTQLDHNNQYLNEVQNEVIELFKNLDN